MDKHKFRLEPTVLSCLIKMYTKCDEPEQVQHIWNNITRGNVKPDNTLYTSILTACAEWAKKSVLDEDSVLVTPALELGKQVHKHLSKSRLRYFHSSIAFNYSHNIKMGLYSLQQCDEYVHKMQPTSVGTWYMAGDEQITRYTLLLYVHSH